MQTRRAGAGPACAAAGGGRADGHHLARRVEAVLGRAAALLQAALHQHEGTPRRLPPPPGPTCLVAAGYMQHFCRPLPGYACLVDAGYMQQSRALAAPVAISL